MFGLNDAARPWPRIEKERGLARLSKIVGCRETGNSGPDDNRPRQCLLLLGFAELAEIFRHCIAVSLRRRLTARAANAAVATGLLHFPAQLHFDLFDIAQRGLNAL